MHVHSLLSAVLDLTTSMFLNRGLISLRNSLGPAKLAGVSRWRHLYCAVPKSIMPTTDTRAKLHSAQLLAVRSAAHHLALVHPDGPVCEDELR